MVPLFVLFSLEGLMRGKLCLMAPLSHLVLYCSNGLMIPFSRKRRKNSLGFWVVGRYASASSALNDRPRYRSVWVVSHAEGRHYGVPLMNQTH